MRTNFKFESLIIQVQIITYIIYLKCACVWHQLGGKNNGNINTSFSSHSRQANVATWFLVLSIDKNPYRLWRGWHMSSSWHHILAISPKKIDIYRVGDNRRTVNTSTSPHISDQLGTEYACLTLLCWFIVMPWVLVCNRYVYIDMNVISDLSTAINNFWDGFDWDKCVNTDRIENLFLLKYNDRK